MMDTIILQNWYLWHLCPIKAHMSPHLDTHDEITWWLLMWQFRFEHHCCSFMPRKNTLIIIEAHSIRIWNVDDTTRQVWQGNCDSWMAKFRSMETFVFVSLNGSKFGSSWSMHPGGWSLLSAIFNLQPDPSSRRHSGSTTEWRGKLNCATVHDSLCSDFAIFCKTSFYVALPSWVCHTSVLERKQ